jgi:hypothetical protein
MAGYLCVVYVSEALRPTVISEICAVALSKRNFVHSFKDVTYNRTSFYFTGMEDIINSALDLCDSAIALLVF